MTGIICVNKEKDITSFGVVAKLRGITREKKVGHTGTLDPMATGVLPVMLGGATRFLDYLPNSDKGYRAKFMLGVTTDTLDITGTKTSQSNVTVAKDDVKCVLGEFTGVIEQIPPMYSAVSVDGQRLYDLARRGVEVERKPRSVEIKSLELADANEETNEYTIDVVCSKGTYVRTLIDDIGKMLSCGAVMTELERTLAMGFTLDDCVGISDLQYKKDNGLGFDDVLISLEKVFEPYGKIYVTPPQAKRFMNGGALDLDRIKNIPKSSEHNVYTVFSDNNFLGLGEIDMQKNQLAVKRLLVRRD